jgi:hypothetical protein
MHDGKTNAKPSLPRMKLSAYLSLAQKEPFSGMRVTFK